MSVFSNYDGGVKAAQRPWKFDVFNPDSLLFSLSFPLFLFFLERPRNSLSYKGLIPLLPETRMLF